MFINAKCVDTLQYIYNLCNMYISCIKYKCASVYDCAYNIYDYLHVHVVPLNFKSAFVEILIKQIDCQKVKYL